MEKEKKRKSDFKPPSLLVNVRMVNTADLDGWLVQILLRWFHNRKKEEEKNTVGISEHVTTDLNSIKETADKNISVNVGIHSLRLKQQKTKRKPQQGFFFSASVPRWVGVSGADARNTLLLGEKLFALLNVRDDGVTSGLPSSRADWTATRGRGGKKKKKRGSKFNPHSKPLHYRPAFISEVYSAGWSPRRDLRIFGGVRILFGWSFKNSRTLAPRLIKNQKKYISEWLQ